MNPPFKRKVIAYITNQDRLLLFKHTAYPEAGIQVPAGTVEANEDLAAAVLREATEETGLQDLSLVRYLGQRDFEFNRNGDIIRQHRHFSISSRTAIRRKLGCTGKNTHRKGLMNVSNSLSSGYRSSAIYQLWRGHRTKCCPN